MSKYRIVKKSITWWTSVFDRYGPVFLYWDEETDHFEVGSHGSARKHKWLFTKEEIDNIRCDFPEFDDNFMLDKVKWGKK